jgi:hypothetical protein
MRFSGPTRRTVRRAPRAAGSHVRLWLIEIEARLLQVERLLRRRRIGQLGADLDQCDAMLSAVLQLIETEEIDISPFCRDLLTLRSRLLRAHDELKTRRNVWWRRLLRPHRDGRLLIPAAASLTCASLGLLSAV